MTISTFIYPHVIQEVRLACDQHIAGASTADDLQRVVQRAECAIVAIEENDIRTKLTDVEGKLELIKFTVETDQQVSETTEVAKDLMEWLSRRQTNRSLT